jgi:hypothetical protein
MRAGADSLDDERRHRFTAGTAEIDNVCSWLNEFAAHVKYRAPHRIILWD